MLFGIGHPPYTSNLVYMCADMFEDLSFVETPPPMGGCVGGWVGQWVGSGQITKNLINLDLIEIIQFCLKIYNF